MSKPVVVDVPTGVATQIISSITLGNSKEIRIWCDGSPLWFGTDNTVSPTTGYPPFSVETKLTVSGGLLGLISYPLWAYFESPDPVGMPSVKVRVWSP